MSSTPSGSGGGAPRRRSVAPGGGSAASPVVKSSYGAPPDSSSTRRQSPVRHPSPSRSNVSGRSGASRPGVGGAVSGRGGGRHVGDSDEDDDDGAASDGSYEGQGAEPAAVRYARLKQRNQNVIGRDKTNGSSLNNTSVNIATAFNQAAGTSISLHLSSASENEWNPRKESHSPLPAASSSARRNFPMPPPPRNPHGSQQQSDRRERAKSPVLDAIAGAARALSPVSYLLKPRVGVMNDQFPEDHEEEDDDEGPSYRSFGSALTSPNKSRANVSYNHHENASFLSATTANTSNGGGNSAEGSYRFEEEERLMKEMEQENQSRDKGKGKEKAVASGSGWLLGLPSFSRSSPAPPATSPKKKGASNDAPYNPRTSSQQSEHSGSSGSEDDDSDDDSDEFDLGHNDGDKVPKTSSSSRRRPRTSHDNQTFKYKPGQSASEESESDGDGGRRKRNRRKSGKIGPLGAEGMTPVVQGKKRRGKKGKASTKKNGASHHSSDEEGADSSIEHPRQPQINHSYDDDATMDFGNDDGNASRDQEEDESFIVQMSSKAAAGVRGPAAGSSSSQLPTYFKSSDGQSFVVVAQDLFLLGARYLLVGLILTCNGLVSALSWIFSKPAEIARGLARSVGLLDWGLASKAVTAAILLGTLAILLDQPATPSNGVVRPPSESSSWIPSIQFNRARADGGAYRTPDLPPESMDELLERLSHLETALGSLSSQAKQSDVKRTEVASHVVQLQDRLFSDIKKVSTEAGKRELAEKERLQSLDRVVGKIRGDVDSLTGRVKKMGEQVDLDAREIERLDDGAEVVRKELKSLGDRVREAEKVAKEASNSSRIARIATEAIESYLPSKLVVQTNPKTGALDIDPSFWKALRAVFVEHGQVEPIVSSRIDKLQASLSFAVSPPSKSSPSPPPPTVVSVAVPQIPSWKEFLSHNEHALRAWSQSEHEAKADSGAVVSKKTFLEVLHRELESLKTTFEKQVTQNIHFAGEEILAKSVAAGKAAAAVAHVGHKLSPSLSKGAKGDQTVTIKSSSGENISDLLTSMIDTALLKYSKDVLAKTDFALFTAGGRVIPSITTETYEIQIKAAPAWSRVFGGKKAATTIEGRAPAFALDPDISVGNCWPFAGSSGQLGVLLARKVVVTEITIEHAAREVSFDMDAAPRDIEVWGTVEGAEHQAKVAAYQARQAEEFASGNGNGLNTPVPSLPPSPGYLLLGSFAYNIDSPNHRQTFAVPKAVKELQVPTGIVVVRIGSNYGADYTCLYRVRVHGEPLTETAEEDVVDASVA